MIDDLGRNDNKESFQHALVRGLLSNTINVGKVVKTSDEKVQKSLDRLEVLVARLAQRVDPNKQDAEATKGWVRKVLDKVTGGGSSSKAPAKSNQAEAYLKSIDKSAKAIYKASQTKNTFWVGVAKFDNKALAQLASISKKLNGKNLAGAASRASVGSARASVSAAGANRSPIRGGGGGGRKGGGGGAGGGPPHNGPGASQFSNLSQTMSASFLTISALAGKILKSMNLDVMDSFKGIIADTATFKENMAQTLYQTQGVGAAAKEGNRQFKRLSDEAKASGVWMHEYYDTISKNMKRGYTFQDKSEKKFARNAERNAKRQISLTTTALHTAQELGMSMDGTNDTFMDWNQHLGMSGNVLAGVGRHIQNIAKDTGLTGEYLEKAIKKADQMNQKMRSLGVLSAGAMKNVLSMSAGFEKFGVGDQGNKLMEALSSRTGMLGASPEIVSLLMNAASRTGDQDLISKIGLGQGLHNKSDLRKMQGGLATEASSFFEQQGVFNKLGMKAGDFDVTKMSDYVEQLRQMGDSGDESARQMVASLETLSQFRFGMGLGDFERVMQGMEESTKTTQERMQDIQAEMGKIGDKGGKAFRDLQTQLDQINTNSLVDAFTELDSQLRKGGSFEDAVKNVGKVLEQELGKEASQSIMSDLTNGKGGGNLIDMLNKRAGSVGMDLNKILKDQDMNVGDISAGLKEGATEAQRETALQGVNQALQAINQQQRVNEDPLSQARDAVKEMNATLSKMSTWVMGFLGPNILLITATLASIAQGIAGLAAMYGGMRAMGGGMGGPLGGGGMSPRGPLGGPGIPSGAPNPSGRGMPPRAGGRGIMGRARGAMGRAGRFMGRHSGKLGMLLGAGAGYYFGDGDMMSTIGGAAAGGVGGRMLGRGMGGVGAGVGAGAANAMAGMPGFGSDCVPVCIVGGLENLMGGGVGGGLVNTALTGIDIADTVGDARSLSKGARGLDKVDDVAKGGGFLSKMFNKIPGFGKVAGVASKGASMLGKALPFASLLTGGLLGGMEAESVGRSKTEGALYGALTGGAGTGSMFSGLVGAQSGSSADEGIGVLGAAGTGAMAGAAIGSIFPGIGTAVGAGVGAVVGAGAEFVKIFTAEQSPLRDSIQGFVGSIWDGTKNVGSWLSDNAANMGSSIWSGMSSIGSWLTDNSPMLAAGTGLVGQGIDTVKGWLGFGSKGSASAVNDGLFDENDAGDAMQSGIMESVKSGGFFSGLKDAMLSALNVIAPGAAATVSMVGRGLFENDSANEATKLGQASQYNAGLFDTDNISNAMNSPDFQANAARVTADMKTRSADVSLSRSMYYDETNGSYIAPGAMDYSDETKAIANPMLSTRESVETSIQRQMLEGGSGATGLLPSMDSIDSFLTGTHAQQQAEMISVLKDIRSALPSGNRPQIIGPESSQNLLGPMKNVKKMAARTPEAGWDITYLDFANGSITTEGRMS